MIQTCRDGKQTVQNMQETVDTRPQHFRRSP